MNYGMHAGDNGYCSRNRAHRKGGGPTPRMSSKMTIKLEPELLRRLQAIAEREGGTVSNSVRRAVIDYIREQSEPGSANELRMDLTLMETSMITQLVRIGVIREPQELFHKAFDNYVSGGDLIKAIDLTRTLSQMKEFPSTVPITTQKQRLDPLQVLEEGEDDEVVEG